jgi:type III restriction enzyme
VPADKTLTADEKAELKEREKEARVWFAGLQFIHRKIGIKTIYDLSATPFFLKGSGYSEGFLFPWVVSDFSLIDAIEAGIVKIPRVPVDDNATVKDVVYLNLWPKVSAQLPRRLPKSAQAAGAPLPAPLEGAIRSLYDNYEKAFQRWERSDAVTRGETPPVFIVVCNNTTVSKMVYDFIAGYTKATEVGEVHVKGELLLVSNYEDDRLLAKPRTILVDSVQLESGDAMSADFKRAAADEIEVFRNEYAQRTGRSADELEDVDILREVMNTVGKKGRLGEGVRCVVSVSMLTEGWDANTVTHILGIRAFGSQLLCEQVVGRGLRRRSYAVNDDGYFEPEYAEVYGVPFSFIRTEPGSGDIKKPARNPVRVQAVPERHESRIRFPKLEGYRVELPDDRLDVYFEDEHRFDLTLDEVPTRTDTGWLVGEQVTHQQPDCKVS